MGIRGKPTENSELPFPWTHRKSVGRIYLQEEHLLLAPTIRSCLGLRARSSLPQGFTGIKK